MKRNFSVAHNHVNGFAQGLREKDLYHLLSNELDKVPVDQKKQIKHNLSNGLDKVQSGLENVPVICGD